MDPTLRNALMMVVLLTCMYIKRIFPETDVDGGFVVSLVSLSTYK